MQIVGRTGYARGGTLREAGKMSADPVLVVGATGRTGRLIVGCLLERSVPVYAWVRDAAKAREVLPPDVPQFIGDVRRGETLTEPMAGVRSVIIATYGGVEHDNSAEIVDYHGTRNVIRQAAAADIDLVVFISTIYATHPEHYQDVEPTSLGWKARAEEVIRSSGVPYCIIRSGWLTDGGGGEPLALSQGDTAEGRISRVDLADLCTQLLFLPDARGKTFEVIAATSGQATSLASAVAALAPDADADTNLAPASAREPAMARPHASPSPRRIVICGGGVAAVEALLALRALVELGVEVHMVAPNRQFVYEPLAVAAPFGFAETHLFELAEIAREQCAELHVDSVASVDAEDRRIGLASGDTLSYDALVVAVGARRHDWLQGALHFGGTADVAAFRALLERLESGSDQRLSFVNPAGTSWTLPLYELALLTASHLVDRGLIGVELTVVTPEADPLSVFGPAASRMLRGELADRGIALRAGANAERIEHGRLHLDPSATLEIDHVVALARLKGPAVPGLPCDTAGFIAVDGQSRVIGLEDVYAAGDGTTLLVKQGGIAAQQADAAAEAIAAQLGAPITPSPIRPMLRGMLLTGIVPIYLRTQIAGTGDSVAIASNPLWWPPSKIAGHYLAPYLADRGLLSRGETLQDRPSSIRAFGQVPQSYDAARELALTFAERDAADRHFKSALQWLDVLQEIDGVLPPGYVDKRADWQDRARVEPR
jgi:sulfide:quinone oxidoreductase